MWLDLSSQPAALAETLLASLDEIDDIENERLWVEEAERRYREYKLGNMSSRPAEDVLRDVRARIERLGAQNTPVDRKNT